LISSFWVQCVRSSFFALSWVGLLGLVLMTACSRAPQVSNSTSSGGEWREFEGTWTAVGSRTIMKLGGDRQAAVSTFNGSLVLAGPSRPGVGFRSEAIVFNDSATGLIGRAVWTNESGDEAYSELRGEGAATNNKIMGTFVGGTGRYAGVTGSYEFSWHFMLENDDGTVQGQSVGLKGRVLVNDQQGGSTAGGISDKQPGTAAKAPLKPQCKFDAETRVSACDGGYHLVLASACRFDTAVMAPIRNIRNGDCIRATQPVHAADFHHAGGRAVSDQHHLA
jgi:hypothetical protein